MSIESLQRAQEEMRRRREAGIPVVRLDPIEKAHANPKSLRLAINGKCWDCCLAQREEIRKCAMKDCTLWPVRPYQGDASAPDDADVPDDTAWLDGVEE